MMMIEGEYFVQYFLLFQKKLPTTVHFQLRFLVEFSNCKLQFWRSFLMRNLQFRQSFLLKITISVKFLTEKSTISAKFLTEKSTISAKFLTENYNFGKVSYWKLQFRQSFLIRNLQFRQSFLLKITFSVKFLTEKSTISAKFLTEKSTISAKFLTENYNFGKVSYWKLQFRRRIFFTFPEKNECPLSAEVPSRMTPASLATCYFLSNFFLSNNTEKWKNLFNLANHRASFEHVGHSNVWARGLSNVWARAPVHLNVQTVFY